jgi:hypothetical protein
MRNVLALPFIALAFLAWGNYGPLMHAGQYGMDGSSLRPFICVGLAYFMIAVIVPIAVLTLRGEVGGWTIPGAFWSLSAGAIGAVGALGIIMAFKFYGRPVYVMPLVFGCAPVVNTFVTMSMSRTFRDANLIFFAGVFIVALGAAGVLYFKPHRAASHTTITRHEDGSITVATRGRDPVTAPSLQALENEAEYRVALDQYRRVDGPSSADMLFVMLSIATTALCWGSYGPILHRGQMKMAGSRLRPFLCVGISYFVVAVLVPTVILQTWPEPGSWMPDGQVRGILWSLAAGSAGALGALGIILAFNFGGKPIFVMPLVFGCAPVVNTFTTMATEQTFDLIQPAFMGSLLLVIVGAVTVLLFAPSGHGPKGKSKSKPKQDAKPKNQPSSTQASESSEASDTSEASEELSRSPHE